MNVRLDKWIAQFGGLSRSEAIKAIRRQRVTINRVLCTIPKQSITNTDDVELDGVRIKPLPPMIAFHKPSGIITSNIDSQGRPCVGDFLPNRYHIVGRLDLETHGLLLFSTDGQLTQHILHPKRQIEREYIATVKGKPTTDLIEKLAQGISTSVGLAKANVLEINENKVRLTVTEGKNRVVRRMLHNAGFSVLDLQRIRFGTICLGSLPPEETRLLTVEEMSMFPNKF